MAEFKTGSDHANNFVRAFRGWFVPLATVIEIRARSKTE